MYSRTFRSSHASSPTQKRHYMCCILLSIMHDYCQQRTERAAPAGFGIGLRPPSPACCDVRLKEPLHTPRTHGTRVCDRTNALRTNMETLLVRLRISLSAPALIFQRVHSSKAPSFHTSIVYDLCCVSEQRAEPQVCGVCVCVRVRFCSFGR